MTAAPEIPADVRAAAREVVPGIPTDIWSAASGVATSTLGFGVNRAALLIARAILAERQRAAEICRNLAPATQDMTSTFVGGALFDAAAAIEAGAQT